MIEKSQYTQSSSIDTLPKTIYYYKYDVFDSPSIFMEIKLIEIRLILFGVVKKEAIKGNYFSFHD
jgi:hypothetical protein